MNKTLELKTTPTSVDAYLDGKLFIRWIDKAIAAQAIAEITARGFVFINGGEGSMTLLEPICVHCDRL